MDDFRRIIIASPPFSCGMGYILEFLLRLDIAVESPHHQYWKSHPESGGYHLNEVGFANLSRMVNGLEANRLFEFKPQTAVLAEHRLDLLNHAANTEKAIVLVRDPIDAVYSWYRRHNIGEHGCSFDQYLDRTNFFINHMHYDMMHAPPMVLYGLFVMFWMNAIEDLLIVRFEDLKTRPVEIMRRVLSHMGVSVPDSRLAEAASRSDYASRRHEVSNEAWKLQNRRSHVEEWREWMTEEDRRSILSRDPIRTAATRLGYIGGDERGDPLTHDSAAWRWFSEICHAISDDHDAEHIAPGLFIRKIENAYYVNIKNFIDIKYHNGASYATECRDAIVGIYNTIELLKDVMSKSPPQKTARLARLLTGYSAFLANCAAEPQMRHVLRSARFISLPEEFPA